MLCTVNAPRASNAPRTRNAPRAIKHIVHWQSSHRLHNFSANERYAVPPGLDYQLTSNPALRLTAPCWARLFRAFGTCFRPAGLDYSGSALASAPVAPFGSAHAEFANGFATFSKPVAQFVSAHAEFANDFTTLSKPVAPLRDQQVRRRHTIILRHSRVRRIYSGIKPCFFGGRSSRLACRASSAKARYFRVVDGSMMSSTSRRPAATYGFAKVCR